VTTRAVARAAWLLAACGGSDAPVQPDGGAALDAASDGRVLPTGPGLAGTLVDESGQPLPDNMVLACMATTCLFGDSDAAGHFAFAIEPTAEVALKTLENLAVSPRLAAALQPVRITGGELVDVGLLHVPALPAGVPFGPASADPQTLAAGDGLELVLRRGDLKPRLGEALVDVAARAIPAERYPPLPELGGEQVIAMYAIHPFAATSTSPIGITAPSTLAAGTLVKFRAISEIDGRLSAPALGKADGAAVTTDPGEGIDELTWLVISR
jgi:hypothetical protein